MTAQASDNQLERHIAALLKSIGATEKSCASNGRKGRAKLQRVVLTDKNGVSRPYWVNVNKKPQGQDGSNAKSNAESVRNRGRKTIRKWLRKIEEARAKEMTRDEIFEAFSNEPKPVAFLKRQLRHLLCVKSETVLSGEAYFIDHAANHHGEMPVKEFLKLQAILDSPDEIVKDTKGDINGDTFGFIKNDGDKRLILFLRKDGDTLVFYRTLYSSNRKLSARYKKISLANSQGLSRPRTSLPRYESDHKSSPASSPNISGLVGKDTLPYSNGAVNKKPKKISKSKKWLWVDGNGKVWARKSVLEAWRRGMAGGL